MIAYVLNCSLIEIKHVPEQACMSSPCSTLPYQSSFNLQTWFLHNIEISPLAGWVSTCSVTNQSWNTNSSFILT